MSLIEELRTEALLPQRLKAVRTKLGVTQERLAEELNVTRVTVARWEDGTRRPVLADRRRIAALVTELEKLALELG